ncbi:MAG: riboflavin synthase [Phycisphaerales bacterium]|jgi:riboflavin synthase|nr:riboflavin synthase [Phycisphaerales bacterium]
MFTGLVQKIGTIRSHTPTRAGSKLTIFCCPWETPPCLGESICVSGCCLTVVDFSQVEEGFELSFDVVPETLNQTTLGGLETGTSVNLERALRADGFLGGHQVQGHIDATVEVVDVSSQEEIETRIRYSLNGIDTDVVIPKGSITIDGVSLTIASVQDDSFDVALVPTTLTETTLGSLQVGMRVNIETDILARTIVQVVRRMHKK